MANKETGLELDSFLPYRLSVAANAVSQVIARAYEEKFSLKNTEWRLLAVLAEEGDLTQQAIVERTNMDKVMVSRAAKALAERGLVRRLLDPADARARRLSLSAPGRRLHARVAPEVLRLEARLLERFSATDAEALQRMLRRLRDAAEAILAEEGSRGSR